jgi:hypothetical protein
LAQSLYGKKLSKLTASDRECVKNLKKALTYAKTEISILEKKVKKLEEIKKMTDSIGKKAKVTMNMCALSISERGTTVNKSRKVQIQRKRKRGKSRKVLTQRMREMNRGKRGKEKKTRQVRVGRKYWPKTARRILRRIGNLRDRFKS